jgi:hypothetical protein
MEALVSGSKSDAEQAERMKLNEPTFARSVPRWS